MVKGGCSFLLMALLSEIENICQGLREWNEWENYERRNKWLVTVFFAVPTYEFSIKSINLYRERFSKLLNSETCQKISCPPCGGFTGCAKVAQSRWVSVPRVLKESDHHQSAVGGWDSLGVRGVWIAGGNWFLAFFYIGEFWEFFTVKIAMLSVWE